MHGCCWGVSDGEGWMYVWREGGMVECVCVCVCVIFIFYLLKRDDALYDE